MKYYIEMNRVNKNGETRQVVPEDFSFLSEADMQQGRAVYNMLANINGFGREYPIVLDGCNIIVTHPETRGTRVVVKEGVILCSDGSVREVEEIDVTVGGVYTISEVDERLAVQLVDNTAEPSPVYNPNGDKVVYCHEDLGAQVVMYENHLPAETDSQKILKNLYRPKRVSELERDIASLAARVAILEEGRV